ncbi:hypothetical protein [Clostridium sp.]|uniref:hypothetical protein n=1 Tax=Clostridium sp. TaxID=1506 RepID=UPI002630A466|nr:hypothetical protein [Clostridium sp.]
MSELIINQIVIPVVGVIVSMILGLIAYFVKQFYDSHKNMLETQRQYLIQKIGIDKYNQDITVIKGAVATAEQLGKEFDWTGIVKHTKVLEMIEGKTGLTDEEIFNTIKAAVSEINKDTSR